MTGLPRVNICFHGIGTPKRPLEPGEADYWISTEQFDAILEEFSGWPTVAFSFDDGNTSDLEIGLDALVRRNLKATFFVLAGRFNSVGSLNPVDVRTLHEAGMTIGTHGMDHHPWRGMDALQTRRELVDARRIISQEVGVTVDQAALPLGRYDRKLLRNLQNLAYRVVYSSDRRSTSANSWLQPRFSVRQNDTAQSLRRSVLSANAPTHRVKLRTVGLIKQYR